MKKIIGFTTSILFTLCFVGCSDSDSESAWDKKEFPIKDYTMQGVRPGDDFFMYRNGMYFNSPLPEVTTDGDTVLIEGFFHTECEKMRDEYYNVKNINGELTDRFFKNNKKWEDDETTDLNKFEAKLQEMITIVNGVKDRKSLVDAIATLTAKGANIPFGITTIPIDNKGYVCPLCEIEGNYDYYPEACEDLLSKYGMSDESVKDNVARAVKFKKEIKAILKQAEVSTPQTMDERLKLWHEITEARAENPLTRSAKPSLVNDILLKLGVSSENIYMEDKLQTAYDYYETLDIEDFKAVMRIMIVSDHVYANVSNCLMYAMGADLIDTKKFVRSVLLFANRMMNYADSYEWINTYISENNKKEISAYCEIMRSSFLKRIDKLDWMSDVTKTKAKEKVRAINFELASSDKWIAEALPELRDATLAENVIELRSKNVKGMLALAGLPMNHNILNICYLSGEYSATTVNAMYVAESNSIAILPSMMLYPMFDPTRSEAMNYAFSIFVIGHEMTHGFDSNGCKYNINGELQNWWTYSDKMEFEERCEMLVKCFDHLEMVPGLMAKGSQTITENIADLGGIHISYDAYLNFLDNAGYKGQSLEIQKKKFFEAYAELWRAKYDIRFINKSYLTEKDEHSLAKERINGILMNMDAWYDTYDVKWGDVLYLPENRRTRIW